MLPRAEAPLERFFDLPFPNDVRRTAEGTTDFSEFPNPRRNSFVRRYLEAMTARLDGFATNGAVYFRFSHPIDPTTVTDESVLLIDVDPESPTRGAIHPAVRHYQENATVFWASNTVAIRPVYGVPLASRTRYAAVVTRSVRPATGGALGRDADFHALVDGGGDDAVMAARAVYGDALTEVAAAGVPLEDVIAATVFTTTDAVGETLAIRDWMLESYPAPTLVDGSVEVRGMTGRLTEIHGRYGPSPIFQEGELPYLDEGGRIVVDADGDPIVQGELEARFALTVPTTPMPEAGYPILLFAHGTGGAFTSVVSNGLASELAALGIAAMGVDQIHHGARNPSAVDPSLLFFNVANPDAARDNTRQSALDVVQQRRLIPNLVFDTALIERDGQPIRFDPANVYFMGHSQGGLNGPLFLAIDDGARAGVLSAASAVITAALIEKVEPLVIPDVLRTLLGLPGSSWEEAIALEGFTYEHPVATMVQTWLEASDASNYAPMIVASPRTGFAPKSLLMTEGLMDPFSPPTSIEALAGAIQIPQAQPVHAMVAGLVARGIAPVTPPVTANLAGGTTTGAFLQFPDDGHFAAFENETAHAQVLGFLGSLVDGGPGTIPAP
ncbi:MAG: hypothetical protein KC619_35970 [Myxococcales bacterium]|nr:hypothetical protein [Myxococcales bacterium]